MADGDAQMLSTKSIAIATVIVNDVSVTLREPRCRRDAGGKEEHGANRLQARANGIAGP